MPQRVHASHLQRSTSSSRKEDDDDSTATRFKNRLCLRCGVLFMKSRFQKESPIAHLSRVILLALVLLTGSIGAAAAQSIEDAALWRVQLMVKTCDEEKAGTDSKVWVQLTNSAAERFWLDRGGNDRRRNAMEYWDVVIPGLREVRDLTQIRVGINGGDAWCFDRLELHLNRNLGNETTARVYSASLAPQWISAERSDGYRSQHLVATALQMRAGEEWNLLGARRRIIAPPVRIRRAILESIVEGVLGHMLSPEQPLERLKWGDRKGRAHVQLERREGDPDNVAHVDLDLNLGGRKSRVRAVDVDFDLRVECSAGQLNLDVVNIDADLSRALKGITLGLGVLVERRLEDGLADLIGAATAAVPICMPPRFDSNSTLIFL